MTIGNLKLCLPNASDRDVVKYAGPLTATMEIYEINTPKRIAAFLAQLAHESCNLSRVRENLNYSAVGLMKTFPRYFPSLTLAREYAHKPERIANRVYANRYGNRGESSGDGWRYSGRGLTQITFYDNYKAVGKALMYDFITNPQALEKPGAATMSAGWFWKEKGLNEIADIDDFEKITKRINGGLNGFPDRLDHWERIKQTLIV